MDYIYNKLISSNKDISNSKHIENINNTKKEIRSGICPRCKGKLVLKEGKYGKFYGCSNYPYCKFTIKNN